MQAYINDGDVLLRMGKKEEALKQYKTALLYDNNADIYYNLGVVYLDVKQTQQAMIHFNKALAINPHHWVRNVVYHGSPSFCHSHFANSQWYPNHKTP